MLTEKERLCRTLEDYLYMDKNIPDMTEEMFNGFIKRFYFELNNLYKIDKPLANNYKKLFKMIYRL